MTIEPTIDDTYTEQKAIEYARDQAFQSLLDDTQDDDWANELFIDMVIEALAQQFLVVGEPCPDDRAEACACKKRAEISASLLNEYLEGYNAPWRLVRRDSSDD